MNKYIVITFAFMGFWFYEASGGADFEPGSNSLVVFADPKPITPRPEPGIERVARADTSGASLTDVTPVRVSTRPEPAARDATAGVSVARMENFAVTEPSPEREEVQQVSVVIEPEPAPEVEASPDYRFVDGDRVNLRGGPGTDYAVVGRLVRNDMVEVLEDSGDGWLHLRVSGTGEEGWMADWLVTASN